MKKLLLSSFLCLGSLLAGPKTELMFSHLNEGMLRHYNRDHRTLWHQQLHYRVLDRSTSDLATKPVVSISAYPSARAIIALDPARSPLLQALFADLLLYVGGAASTEEVLTRVSFFVHKGVFDPARCQAARVDAWIEDWIENSEHTSERTSGDFTLTKKGDRIPVIPLDDFLDARLGMCCHHALVTAYFMERLLNETQWLPPGRCDYVRDVVTLNGIESGHAWNVYVEEGEKKSWHIDSTWNLISPT